MTLDTDRRIRLEALKEGRFRPSDLRNHFALWKAIRALFWLVVAGWALASALVSPELLVVHTSVVLATTCLGLVELDTLACMLTNRYECYHCQSRSARWAASSSPNWMPADPYKTAFQIVLLGVAAEVVVAYLSQLEPLALAMSGGLL